MQQMISVRSRDTRWPLISICGMFRHYDKFDPLDLLIVHAISMLRDLRRAGVNGPDDLRGAKIAVSKKKAR
jgi:hypothetical protein